MSECQKFMYITLLITDPRTLIHIAAQINTQPFHNTWCLMKCHSSCHCSCKVWSVRSDMSDSSLMFIYHLPQLIKVPEVPHGPHHCDHLSPFRVKYRGSNARLWWMLLVRCWNSVEYTLGYFQAHVLTVNQWLGPCNIFEFSENSHGIPSYQPE